MKPDAAQGSSADVLAAFDEVIELAPDAREQRLSAIGRSDPDLRRKVEALLAADAEAEQRLAHVDRALGSPRLRTGRSQRDPDPLKLVGRTVSHFRVIEPLAHGGMGIVYRAEDTHLRRPIALKFPLPTQYVDRDAKERFLHEARIAGALDHPNLCAIHEAGETEDGHLYYAMPLYDGESLKARLAHEGALPIPDALNIAMQIATGLSAAHRDRVVHRDLKPANVMLLPDGTVRILDFGLAKESDLSLTEPWATFGTVSYMAPEQIQGREVDSRADLWALGVVLYEMLTGKRPFHGEHPVAVAHAILHAEPDRPSALRAGIPSDAEAVVLTLLRKDREERYTSAEDVVAAMAAISFDRRARLLFGLVGARRRTVWGGAAALAALVIVAAGLTIARAPQDRAASVLTVGTGGEPEELLVADFDIGGGVDSTLGRVMAEAVRTDLSQSNVVAIMQPRAIRPALERMQRPADAPLVSAVARELAQREGIKAVVEGELTPLRSNFVVTLRIVSADGDELASFREATDPANLVRTVGGLTRRLRSSIGESLENVRASPALEQVTTSSLQALRKYAEGKRALTYENDHIRAVTLLKEAVAVDSTFASAWMVMSAAYRNAIYPTNLADAAAERAYRFRDRLPERERYHAVGLYFRGGPGRDRVRAAEAYEAGVRLDSGGFANNLGLLYMSRRDYARAESLFRWYVVRGRDLQVAYENLSNVLYFQGKRSEAESIEAETSRRFPDAEKWGRAAWYAYNRGQLDSAQRMVERQRAEGDATQRVYAALHLAMLNMVRGRLAEAERARGEAAEANQARGISRDSLTDALWVASLDIWHRDRRERGLRRMDAALESYPIASLPLTSPLGVRDRSYHIWVARNYAHARRPDRARAVLARFDADVRDTTLRRASAPEVHSVLGEIALAEGRPLVALAEFRRADRLPDGPVHLCAICNLPDVGRAFDQAGMADSAIAVFERYLETPQLTRVDVDADFAPRILHRLGELYEARGDRDKALHYYGRFVELWHSADAELQPRVDAVRRRMERLSASE